MRYNDSGLSPGAFVVAKLFGEGEGKGPVLGSMTTMDLSTRQRSILNQIVERYIASGEPVASRQVARSSNVSLSPATVRNVMAELETDGYLYRSHKSAGSVPSDLGFRVYVDSIVPGRGLPAAARRSLVEKMTLLRRELAEDLGWVAHLVAEVTNEAGVAVRPMGEKGELEVVSLLPIGERRILGVVVTTNGSVEKRVFFSADEVSREELIRIANTLNHLFHGRSMDWIARHPLVVGTWAGHEDSTVFDEHGADPEIQAFAHDLFSTSQDPVEVLFAGTENLMMRPDFQEVDRLRSLMVLFQDREKIVQEWRQRFVGSDTQVVIGDESEMTASGHLGMVATLFHREGKRIGAVGIVGPRRMNYLRVIPVIEFVGHTLTQMLDEAM